MKKLIILLICVLSVTEAMGQDVPDGFQQSFRRNGWDIGPEIFYHRYSETDNNGLLLIEEDGIMYGVYATYTHRDWVAASAEEEPTESGWMFAAEGSLSYGQVDYDGQYMNGTPLTISGIDDTIGELRLLLGWDSLNLAAPSGTNSIKTIYAGIGYRYWNDDLSIHPAGYERESTYLYIPVGLAAIREATGGWYHGPRLEFDWLLVGEQVSHLSNVGLTDIENRQNSGYGFRFSWSFHKKGDRNDFMIEPFVRGWFIDESDVDFAEGVGYVEPENDTLEAGIRFLWKF